MSSRSTADLELLLASMISNTEFEVLNPVLEHQFEWKSNRRTTDSRRFMLRYGALHISALWISLLLHT